MTDLITAEEARNLLADASPNWRRVDTSVHVGLVGSYDPEEGFPLYGGFDLRGAPRAEGNATLAAAAPDLARTVIALHAQLADAQAAQAMVVERAADMIEDNVRHAKGLGREIWAMPDLRALADADGLALVQALRAERDRVAAINVKHCESVNTLLVDGARLEDRAKSAEADRDRLAAANAVLEAKVAGLVEALRNLVGPDCMYDGRNIIITAVNHGDAIRLVAEARAALATQEAGT